jgi:hypothetical protein
VSWFSSLKGREYFPKNIFFLKVTNHIPFDSIHSLVIPMEKA